MELVNGTVKGTAHDIETWVRNYFEPFVEKPYFQRRTPPTRPMIRVMREERGPSDRFALRLDACYKPDDLDFFVCGRIKVAGWSNGTTDVRIQDLDSTLPPADVLFFEQNIPGGDLALALYRKILEQMSGEFVTRFPIVAGDEQTEMTSKGDRQPAQQPEAAGAGDAPPTNGDDILLPDPVEMKKLWPKYTSAFALQVAKELPKAYKAFQEGRTKTRQWGPTLVEEMTGQDRSRLSTLFNRLQDMGWTHLNGVPLKR